ncbi:MAG: hypothetical protein K2J80_03980 [Oscillospiraceae bacterium]|nr:hypothetical protein [Oscillospiraceae bacterium]
MGYLKFVIPFVGGAVTAAAVGLAAQKKKEEREGCDKVIEIDAEFEERGNADEKTTDH